VTDPVAAIARRRLERARNTLREADTLIENQHWPGAVNRLYYAAFYAARALLATHGVEASKHSGTIALFQRHFVKAGVVPPDIARVLQRSFDERQAADYGDLPEAAPAHVLDLRDGVHGFLSFCERWLSEQYPRN
jgi:uncharacterized protein (UPF0332 family)